MAGRKGVGRVQTGAAPGCWNPGYQLPPFGDIPRQRGALPRGVFQGDSDMAGCRALQSLPEALPGFLPGFRRRSLTTAATVHHQNLKSKFLRSFQLLGQG